MEISGAKFFSVIRWTLLSGGNTGIVCVSCLFLALAANHAVGRAQLQTTTPLDRVVKGQNDSPDMLEAERKMARQMNAIRKKQMDMDSAKLLALAGELKAETEQSPDAKWSASTLKKAEQIEKLARKVRTEMVANMGVQPPTLSPNVFQIN